MTIPFTYLETPRLKLRMLSPEIWTMIHQTNDEQYIRKEFNIQSDKHYQKELRRMKEGLVAFNKSIFIFQLIDKNTNQLIGDCGFHTWYTEHHCAEIGYTMFDESNKHKGYMTEALDEIINYGFDVLNLNRIEAYVSADNIPSLKLMAHFKFKEEGYVHGHYFKDGVFYDSKLFGLLKSDHQRVGK